MTTFKKISTVLMALIVMFGLVAATVQPAAAAPEEAVTACKQWHTVERGEYLSQIARLYNTSWRTLADINDLQNPSRIYPGQQLCVSLTNSDSNPVIPSTGGTTRVYATSVEEDKDVSLAGRSLVANARYFVYLSKYGASSTNAILVGTAYTDKNGAFKWTYKIPKKLMDVSKIYVYLSNGRGDTTSNWFINATADGNVGGIGSPALGFSVTSVKEDQWVKIKTSNLPANVTFNVYMGKAGSKGVNGILVGSLVDDDGGSVRATFEIPEELYNRSKIDLRLENKALGTSAYVTFEN